MSSNNLLYLQRQLGAADLGGNPMRRLMVLLAFALYLTESAPATAAMYAIENPADKISNPANRISNPAAQTNNPASNIYNPGDRMGNRSPLSPPTPPAPKPAAQSAAPAVGASRSDQPAEARRVAKPAIPEKKYYFQTVGAYLAAAKKSFAKDDYPEFLAVTEDALRRINAGTLKASAGTRHKLQNFKTFGYGLLE
jgi:hypothetical protein